MLTIRYIHTQLTVESAKEKYDNENQTAIITAIMSHLF